MIRNSTSNAPGIQPSLLSGQELRTNQPKIQDKTDKVKAGPPTLSAEPTVKIRKVEESKAEPEPKPVPVPEPVPAPAPKVEPLKKKQTANNEDLLLSERGETEYDQQNAENSEKTKKELQELKKKFEEEKKSGKPTKIGEVHLSRAKRVEQISGLEKKRANTYDAFATPPDIPKAKDHRVGLSDS